jgi:hypothetical protein
MKFPRKTIQTAKKMVRQYCWDDSIHRSEYQHILRALDNETVHRLSESDKSLLWDALGCYKTLTICNEDPFLDVLHEYVFAFMWKRIYKTAKNRKLPNNVIPFERRI